MVEVLFLYAILRLMDVKQLCQVILKSPYPYQIYGPDKAFIWNEKAYNSINNNGGGEMGPLIMTVELWFMYDTSRLIEANICASLL